MADFVLPERRVPIDLAGGDYDGAEIIVNLRVPMNVVRQYDVLLADDSVGVPAFIEGAGALLFTHGRPTWNLADADGPIPATPEDFGRLDWQTQRAVINAWMSGVVNPPRPLSLPSSATEPSPEASTSPPNSTGPSDSTDSSEPTPATP